MYLLLNHSGGLGSLNALGDRDGGEATLLIADDHLVAVLDVLRGTAGDVGGVDGLLEAGQQGLGIGDAVDGGFLLLDALVLDALQFLLELGGLDALASGGALDFVGDGHQFTGKRALAGTSQVGDLVAGGRSAQTAQTDSSDRRSYEDDDSRLPGGVPRDDDDATRGGSS